MKELKKREQKQLEKEQNILNKAAELIIKYGFDKVSMDDLAKASEYTKRTLYRYFTCKEDLLFAVALKGYKKLRDIIKAYTDLENIGFMKIKSAYYAIYEFYTTQPQHFLLISRVTSLKSELEIEMPYRQQYMEFDKQLFGELLQLFDEAKLDKSIRQDYDITKLTFSSVFVITGFFQLLSQSGQSFTSFFHLDMREFIKFTIDSQLEVIKAKNI